MWLCKAQHELSGLEEEEFFSFFLSLFGLQRKETNLRTNLKFRHRFKEALVLANHAGVI